MHFHWLFFDENTFHAANSKSDDTPPENTIPHFSIPNFTAPAQPLEDISLDSTAAITIGMPFSPSSSISSPFHSPSDEAFADFSPTNNLAPDSSSPTSHNSHP
ncbi:hypothetical protein Patl1_35558 [Pistacia atlantica]|nr:hypothetical protein Patl1_35558 [Pistacia atlantica]